jgi:hypothetical protein
MSELKFLFYRALPFPSPAAFGVPIYFCCTGVELLNRCRIEKPGSMFIASFSFTFYMMLSVSAQFKCPDPTAPAVLPVNPPACRDAGIHPDPARPGSVLI